jgi:hypothetical protein
MVFLFGGHSVMVVVMRTELALTAHQDDLTTSDNAIADVPSL